jgi:hypothetical protein
VNGYRDNGGKGYELAQPLTSDSAASTIGDFSVTYVEVLGLWVMLYDNGVGGQGGPGIQLLYATAPWGPWMGEGIGSPLTILSRADQRAIADGVWNHGIPPRPRPQSIQCPPDLPYTCDDV